MMVNFERDTREELADLIDIRIHELLNYTDCCVDNAEAYRTTELQAVASALATALFICEAANVPVIMPEQGGDS